MNSHPAKSTKKLVLITALTLGLFLILAKLEYHSLTDYLSVTKPVDANVLLIEGWMSNYTLYIAAQEFNENDYLHIITTGLEKQEYYRMTMNGNLVFYRHNKIQTENSNVQHKIGIALYGETKGSNKAHFNVFLNDSIAASFYAKKTRKKYDFSWFGNISEIDSITIQFDNDKLGNFGDRNLNVKEIVIDNKEVISYLNNAIYYINTAKRKEKRTNNYSSYAESARLKLINLGIDPANITAIPGKNTTINRTLTSALAVKDYFMRNGIISYKINILSSGPHSRRTWLTYKKILGKDFEIGIISLPVYVRNYNTFKRVQNTFTESLKIVYYRFILVKYSKESNVNVVESQFHDQD